MQGGLTYAHVKYAVKQALTEFRTRGYL
jgi:cystathionine beta-lyase family protein involved in aluminum resistance